MPLRFCVAESFTDPLGDQAAGREAQHFLLPPRELRTSKKDKFKVQVYIVQYLH
jgi:hypothetical protein